MKDLAAKRPALQERNLGSFRTNWLFEIESYSRARGESLIELRDNLRLKKALKKAVERDLAPVHLIESIKAGIRV